MKTVARFALTTLLYVAGATPFSAVAAMLDLPCTAADGKPVPDTKIVTLLADFSEDEVSAPAENGRCRIDLKPGVYWVKAESPDRRSAPARIRWPSSTADRELRLVPRMGRNTERQEALQAMVAADQAVRVAQQQAQREGDAIKAERLGRAMEAVDEIHEAQLRRRLATDGFPRAADVGYEGVRVAWLLVQHSQALLARQLPALRKAVEAGELDRGSLALSEDRVRMWAGQPQRYGSQLQSDKNGKLVLYRLESAGQVDAWREAMDLEPLADYLKRFGIGQ
jgi:hypothetical protein